MILDTAPPDAPAPLTLAAHSNSGATNDTITNHTNVAIITTAEPNAIITLSNAGTSIAQATADAVSGIASLNTTLTEGAHTLSAIATDIAGNNSTTTQNLTVTVDTTPPTLNSGPNLLKSSDSGESDSDDITSKTNLTLTGKADAGHHITLFSDTGNTPLHTTANASGFYTFNLSNQAEGTHKFTVRSKDAAGNTADFTTPLIVTVDTIAPANTLSSLALKPGDDTGPSNSDNITSKTNISLLVHTMGGTSASLYQGETLLKNLGKIALGNNVLTATASLDEGANSFSVVHEDIAGNRSTPETPFVVTRDTTAPTGTPDSFALLPADDTGTNNTDLITSKTHVSFRLKADGAHYASVRNTTLNADYTATRNTGSNLLEGTINLRANTENILHVRILDGGGNPSADISTYTVTALDTPSAPAKPNLVADDDTGILSTDNLTSKTLLTISSTATLPHAAMATFHVFNTIGTTTNAILSTPFRADGLYTISLPVTQGAHTLSTQIRDAAGNLSPLSDPLVVTVDTAAPQQTVVSLNPANDSGLKGDLTTNNATVILRFSDENGQTVRGSVTLNGTDAGILNSGYALNLKDLGTANLRVRGIDDAGNQGPEHNVTLTYDATPPDNTQTAQNIFLASASDLGDSPTDGITSSKTLVFSWYHNEAGSRSRATLNGVSWNEDQITYSDNGTAHHLTISNFADDGHHTLNITNSDASGNFITNPLKFTFTTDYTPPVKPSAPILYDIITAADSTHTFTRDNKPTFRIPRPQDSDASRAIIFNANGTSLGEASSTQTVGSTQSYLITLNTALDRLKTHTLNAKLRDAAGNLSDASETFHVSVGAAFDDNAKPSSIRLTPASDSGISDHDNITNITKNLSLTAKHTPGSTLVLTSGATTLAKTTANLAGDATFSIAELNEGLHTLSVRDAQTSASTPFAITVDTTPIDPSTVSITLADSGDSGVKGDSITNSSTALKLAISANPHQRIILHPNWGEQQTITLDSTGMTVISSVIKHSVDTFQLTWDTLDAAGNKASSQSPVTFSIDTTPAVASLFKINGADQHGSLFYTTMTDSNVFGVTSEPSTHIKLFSGTTLLGKTTTDASGTATFTVDTLPSGASPLHVTATDNAGNLYTSPSYTATVESAQNISELSFQSVAIATDPNAGENAPKGRYTAYDSQHRITIKTQPNTAVLLKSYLLSDPATKINIGTQTADASGIAQFTFNTPKEGVNAFEATGTFPFGNAFHTKTVQTNKADQVISYSSSFDPQVVYGVSGYFNTDYRPTSDTAFATRYKNFYVISGAPYRQAPPSKPSPTQHTPSAPQTSTTKPLTDHI